MAAVRMVPVRTMFVRIVACRMVAVRVIDRKVRVRRPPSGRACNIGGLRSVSVTKVAVRMVSLWKAKR